MPRPVRGVLAVEGVQTGDGRIWLEGAATWVDPPLPLAWLVDGDQHVMPDEAPQIGTIDTITRAGNEIVFTGTIDDATEDGAEAVRRMETGAATNGNRFGVSVDADDYEVELVATQPMDDTEDVVLVSAAGDGDVPDGEVVMEDSADALIERYTRIRIRGATLCAVPAFAEAYVELDDSAVEEPAPVVEDEPAVAASADHVCTCHATPVDRSIVAAGSRIPVRPPAAWFGDPQFGVGGEDPRLVRQPEGFWACPLEATEEGQVFGHVGGPGCHVGMPGCVRLAAETSHDFSDFNRGFCVTADGSRVTVGQITLVGGHADLSLDARQAAAHYDDTRSAVADVHVGWDDRNNLAWFAGALRPDVSAEQLRVLCASGVSGDWRPMAGDPRPRLIAALSVNVPGFGIRRQSTHARVAGGQVMALVASAIRPDPHPWADAVASQERRLAVLEAAMEVVLNGGREALVASVESPQGASS